MKHAMKLKTATTVASRRQRPRRSLSKKSIVAEPAGAWATLATDAFARDWNNERDAEYDRWEQHYGVPKR